MGEAGEAFAGQDGDHEFAGGEFGEARISGGEVLRFERDDQRVGVG